MAPTQTSLTQHVTTLDAGAEVVAVAFLGRTPAYALSDGTILRAEIGDERRSTAHPDATVLIARGIGGRIVTGGDDGRVVETRGDGEPVEIGNMGSRWIDALALRADGATAWSAGKDVRARDAKGDVKSFTAPSGVRGLAFMPKGYRLAVSHYNGVSLWFPNLVGEPEGLAWRGSHLDVTVSPDGRFVVSAMQENALHGWRVADHKDMRMTGYPAKTRSFSWSHDGNWCATSGAEACIVWPFSGKDGPMGQAPREAGVRPSRVSCVAFHPKSLVLAAGYEDGFLMLCRLSDGAELLVRDSAGGKGAVTAMQWSDDGRRLLFGARDGSAGVLDLPA
jgi:WD40 repeat protein